MKEGIFVGPKPWKVLKDPNFEKELTAVKWHAWKGFQWPCKNFLGNTMSPLPQELKTYLKLTKNKLITKNNLLIDLTILTIRGVFEKYRDCMLCTNNTCNSDKSFVF